MKRLQISQRLMDLISKSAGPDIDTDKIAVFEAIALNTLPISQRSTIFNGAKASRSTLQAMVDYINKGETVPVITMHDTSKLPVGTLFHSEMYVNQDDEAEVRAWFYVDLAETELLSKLDQGIINEVSVGILAEKLLCSECGFDYLGAEAEFDNFYYKECNEGHVLGENGTHVRLIGLEKWTEISLVNRGAANKPKIIGRSDSRLEEGTVRRLAASGIPEGLAVLSALAPSALKQPDNKEPDNMDMEKILDQMSDLKASAAGAKKDLELSLNDVTKLTAELTSKDEEIAALKATVDAIPEAPDAAELEALRASEKAAKDFLSEAISKTEIALGRDPAGLPETVAEMTAKLSEVQSELTAALPVGGVANAADAEDNHEAAKTKSFAAFVA